MEIDPAIRILSGGPPVAASQVSCVCVPVFILGPLTLCSLIQRVLVHIKWRLHCSEVVQVTLIEKEVNFGAVVSSGLEEVKMGEGRGCTLKTPSCLLFSSHYLAMLTCSCL